jgi:hypothetical protein
MMETRARLILAAAAIFIAPSVVLADKPPTDEERAKIESVLRAEGFTSWKKVELEDGEWEVDDATGSDGRQYDLKLDKQFAIIERKPD